MLPKPRPVAEAEPANELQSFAGSRVAAKQACVKSYYQSNEAPS
jgi:hypothetical protein